MQGQVDIIRVLGIITEYNPFHAGHLYHLQKSVEVCSADHVVCVMSGNFIQRGEPAIVNKWARAEIALRCGVDLVIELPVVYAMSSAEFFAWGAVKLLDSLGTVDTLCFGSENGRLDELLCIAEILVEEPEEYRQLLKKFLDLGESYPMAREKALKQFLRGKEISPSRMRHLMGSSNNILGIEYLKALKRLKSSITPATIARVGSSYNAEALEGQFSSATAIRRLFSGSSFSFGDASLKQMLPEASLAVLQREFAAGRGPVFPRYFQDILLADIRRMPAERLQTLPFIGEGLENRIKEASKTSGTLDHLLGKIATKRYPKTRIQRALFHLLTGLTAKEFEDFNRHGGPQYIRVLGFNEKGRKLLARARKQASLPIINKAAAFRKTSEGLSKRMLEIESVATDIYVLGYDNPDFRATGQDFTTDAVRL